MIARIVVFVPLVVAEALSLFLFFNAPAEWRELLLYPLAGGYYPWATEDGQPGYDPQAWELWRLAELGVYTALGVTAFLKRSLPLALGNAALWLGSLAFLVYRFIETMEGFH